MSPESAYYPMCLNLKGRTCIVVGGGRVALRKVRKLLEYGADVRVISPELCPELAGLLAEGKIQINSRPYQPGDLRQAWLAFAATGDPDTNQRVAVEARTWRIWVNVASDAENSDFILPSSGRWGNITIAVSTDGVSPALARKIRTRLENTIGNEYAILLESMDEVEGLLEVSLIDAQGNVTHSSKSDAVGRSLSEEMKNDLMNRRDPPSGAKGAQCPDFSTRSTTRTTSRNSRSTS